MCEAWRTAILVALVAGDDRRKADRAVSMVEMAGDEPVGSARILGSNMVERCVWLRCFAVDCCLAAVDFSTFCRLRNLQNVRHSVGNTFRIYADLLMPLLSSICRHNFHKRHESLVFNFD